MFPYKSNAFHAYEPKRNPLKSRTFASLIAIAMLLGVLTFSEARADIRPSDQQCDSLSNHLLAGVEALSQFTNLFKNAQS